MPVIWLKRLENVGPEAKIIVPFVDIYSVFFQLGRDLESEKYESKKDKENTKLRNKVGINFSKRIFVKFPM